MNTKLTPRVLPTKTGKRLANIIAKYNKTDAQIVLAQNEDFMLLAGQNLFTNGFRVWLKCERLNWNYSLMGYDPTHRMPSVAEIIREAEQYIQTYLTPEALAERDALANRKTTEVASPEPELIPMVQCTNLKSEKEIYNLLHHPVSYYPEIILASSEQFSLVATQSNSFRSGILCIIRDNFSKAVYPCHESKNSLARMPVERLITLGNIHLKLRVCDGTIKLVKSRQKVLQTVADIAAKILPLLPSVNSDLAGLKDDLREALKALDAV